MHLNANNFHRGILVAIASSNLLLAACGSSVSSTQSLTNPSTTAPATTSTSSDIPTVSPYASLTTVPHATQSARFLNQATFGARPQDLTDPLLTSQNYSGWIAHQATLPISSHLAAVTAMPAPVSQSQRVQAWWGIAVNGSDQLRQRVAFALSELFVVSDESTALSEDPAALAYYNDLLAKDSLGNFRTLLEDVTLSPAMGLYLNMQGNQKSDPAHNIHADENYAREVMQLFTIGLNQLNMDGSLVLDSSGAPIPTYTQNDVDNMARVFTGWTFGNSSSFQGAAYNTLVQMVPYAEFHDTGAKSLFNGSISFPAGNTPQQDLKIALDALFNHQNTAPFISKQLIQRLVTSNPSPAYIQRVANVFANDGTGVRGNMLAVVTAVLTDTEARSDTMVNVPTYGKRREPLLVFTQLWRVFNGNDDSVGGIDYSNPEQDLGQAPLRSPSVFNFFKPFYAPPGPIAAQGLVAPEFQLGNASSYALFANALSSNIRNKAKPVTTPVSGDIRLHVANWVALAKPDYSGPLIDVMNLVLMAGQMNSQMRATLTVDVDNTSVSDGGYARLEEAIYQIMSSQQYQIER